MTSKKVVLITGASSGIGRSCALHLSSRGHEVYGTTRKGPETSEPFRTVSMDVTDDRSVAEGVKRVVDQAGRLDVVVNNAGMGFFGPVEETSVEEARRQFETNVFGVLRVCRATLPILRQQQGGVIVNMSSIGGILGLPFEGLYSASKFALEGLSEALRIEVRPFGIRVVLVEPGDIRTDFPRNRVQTLESRQGSSYQAMLEKVLSVFRIDEELAPPPDVVARLVGRIMEMRSPAPRYRVGRFLHRLAGWGKGLLPGRVFEGLVRSAYKI